MERNLEQELRNHIASLTPEQRDVQLLLECVRKKPRKEFIELYLSMGLSARFVSKTEDTLLHVIASKKTPEILSMLIDHGADIMAKNKRQETPLHIAASSGDVLSTAILLQAGCDVNALDAKGKTALIRSLDSSNALELCHTLLQYDADITVTGLEKGRLIGHLIVTNEDPRLITIEAMNMGLFAFPDAEGAYPIHLAIHNGNLKVLKAFTLLGHDLNLPNKRTGDTPMHYAVRYGRTELLHYLYEHGASEEIPNQENETAGELGERMQWPKVIDALESAREEAETRIIQHSLKKESTMNNPEESGKRTRKSRNTTISHNAKYKEQVNDLVIFKYVVASLKSGKTKISSMRSELRQLHDYNMCGEDKLTLMHLAAIHDCPDLIKYLLGKHANPKLKDSLNRTPLMYAILSGNAQSVKLLMKQYYDVHETDIMNNSLFVLAYWMEMYELAMQFIDEGADDRGLLKGYTPSQKKNMKNG